MILQVPIKTHQVWHGSRNPSAPRASYECFDSSAPRSFPWNLGWMGSQDDAGYVVNNHGDVSFRPLRIGLDVGPRTQMALSFLHGWHTWGSSSPVHHVSDTWDRKEKFGVFRGYWEAPGAKRRETHIEKRLTCRNECQIRMSKLVKNFGWICSAKFWDGE